MSMEVSASSISTQKSTHSSTEEFTQPDMESSDNKTQQVVCSFYLKGECRFGDQCFNLHPANAVLEVKKDPTKAKAKKKSGKNRSPPPEEMETGKKPPMKTAGDVRKRIQWDPELKKEYFTVGYLDRFLGVIEKPFTAFTWEHIAHADIDELSIPQHRIQYFSYKGTKVWDKNVRLDHVFGSTGADLSIHDVIQQVEEEQDRKHQAFDPDDSDSDDEDIIVMGNSSAIKEAVDAQKAKFDKIRATHFLCIRVFNDDLKRAVAEVQEKVCMEEPVLRSCVMPSELMHVTLAMIRINNPDAMIQLVDLLNELQPKIKALVSAPQQKQVIVQGLSTFGARVLYTKLQVPEAFNAIVQMLKESLQKIPDLLITNHFDFVPHMTLLKVNRPTAHERRSKYLNSILYNDFIENDFGVIDMNNISLCIIDDNRGPDSFYVTCKTIEF